MEFNEAGEWGGMDGGIDMEGALHNLAELAEASAGSGMHVLGGMRGVPTGLAKATAKAAGGAGEGGEDGGDDDGAGAGGGLSSLIMPDKSRYACFSYAEYAIDRVGSETDMCFQKRPRFEGYQPMTAPTPTTGGGGAGGGSGGGGLMGGGGHNHHHGGILGGSPFGSSGTGTSVSISAQRNALNNNSNKRFHAVTRQHLVQTEGSVLSRIPTHVSSKGSIKVGKTLYQPTSNNGPIPAPLDVNQEHFVCPDQEEIASRQFTTLRCLKSGKYNYEEAKGMVELNRKLGVLPSSAVYRSLIKMASQHGKPAEISDFFDEMRLDQHEESSEELTTQPVGGDGEDDASPLAVVAARRPPALPTADLLALGVELLVGSSLPKAALALALDHGFTSTSLGRGDTSALTGRVLLPADLWRGIFVSLLKNSNTSTTAPSSTAGKKGSSANAGATPGAGMSATKARNVQRRGLGLLYNTGDDEEPVQPTSSASAKSPQRRPQHQKIFDEGFGSHEFILASAKCKEAGAEVSLLEHIEMCVRILELQQQQQQGVSGGVRSTIPLKSTVPGIQASSDEEEKVVVDPLDLQDVIHVLQREVLPQRGALASFLGNGRDVKEKTSGSRGNSKRASPATFPTGSPVFPPVPMNTTTPTAMNPQLLVAGSGSNSKTLPLEQNRLRNFCTSLVNHLIDGICRSLVAHRSCAEGENRRRTITSSSQLRDPKEAWKLVIVLIETFCWKMGPNSSSMPDGSKKGESSFDFPPVGCLLSTATYDSLFRAFGTKEMMSMKINAIPLVSRMLHQDDENNSAAANAAQAGGGRVSSSQAPTLECLISMSSIVYLHYAEGGQPDGSSSSSDTTTMPLLRRLMMYYRDHRQSFHKQFGCAVGGNSQLGDQLPAQVQVLWGTLAATAVAASKTTTKEAALTSLLHVAKEAYHAEAEFAKNNSNTASTLLHDRTIISLLENTLTLWESQWQTRLLIVGASSSSEAKSGTSSSISRQVLEGMALNQKHALNWVLGLHTTTTAASTALSAAEKSPFWRSPVLAEGQEAVEDFVTHIAAEDVIQGRADMYINVVDASLLASLVLDTTGQGQSTLVGLMNRYDQAGGALLVVSLYDIISLLLPAPSGRGIATGRCATPLLTKKKEKKELVQLLCNWLKTHSWFHIVALTCYPTHSTNTGAVEPSCDVMLRLKKVHKKVVLLLGRGEAFEVATSVDSESNTVAETKRVKAAATGLAESGGYGALKPVLTIDELQARMKK